MLLREIPTETRDPVTKDRYGLCLVLHVVGQVLTTVLELLMACHAIDFIVGSLVPKEPELCLSKGLIEGLMIAVPGICLLIIVLVRIGVMIEL